MSERLPPIEVMGQASAQAYQPGDGEVCISIRAIGAPFPDLSSRFDAVLSLAFDDDYHPGWEARGNALTAAQADKVVAFVARHRTARKLVIHCFAGVSRSASMAEGLRRTFAGLDQSRRIVNRPVYDRIVQAHQRLCVGRDTTGGTDGQ
jgi:predicted protein tyrosine phosphatase